MGAVVLRNRLAPAAVVLITRDKESSLNAYYQGADELHQVS